MIVRMRGLGLAALVLLILSACGGSTTRSTANPTATVPGDTVVPAVPGTPAGELTAYPYPEPEPVAPAVETPYPSPVP